MSELSPEAKFIKLLGAALNNAASDLRSVESQIYIDRGVGFGCGFVNVPIRTKISPGSKPDTVVIENLEFKKIREIGDAPDFFKMLQVAMEFSKSDETSILLHKLST